MTISQKGIDLIKLFEGFEANAYPDPATGAEPWTIGYGSTYMNGDKVKKGDKITVEAAEKLLKHTIVSTYGNAIDANVKKPLTQNQYDALCSFVYNVGVGNFKRSTLLKKINVNPDDPAIINEFLKWNKAAGKPMVGLTKRRTAEAQLYFKEA